ncbi:ATP-grasp fold amidoligase family protein [Salinivibrio kushneri]|uniref:ATP-grasp fold amidoligase family protein n=1 Tax=Salinivibrio kushneri TaxID=1908198 RepID=UPI000C8384FF|nr:ATP-grasp fold amidoligase family protein [Salinivibrio kushneri]
MKKILKEIAFIRKIYFWLRFIYNNKYIPDFKNPKTYNEKVNYRKRNANHPLFSTCADKIAAKEYVASKIGKQYIIPTLFIGNSITETQARSLLEEHGDCLLKANHNSGPVYLLTTDMTQVDLKAACDDVNHQLTIDFGKYQNEPWYSEIKPQVLVEKRIYPEEGEKGLKDYKFHVFRQEDGSFKVILEVHFDQGYNHTISYFDEELNWLPITVEHPNIVTNLEKPINYNLMVEKAKELATEFTHVRVDFYNVDGNIYFGELTFAKTGGGAIFMHKMFDLWMGNLWQGDPAK